VLLDSLPRAGYLIWEKLTLATKAKKPAAKKAESATKVTRIVATDAKPAAKTQKPTVKASAATSKKTPNEEKTGIRNPFPAIGGYFAGAWFELREVRWPNRRATWGLTVAVLAFTAFFIVLILLLDALFKYLFQLILG
jgi:preprotein translocase SecE subunit